MKNTKVPRPEEKAGLVEGALLKCDKLFKILRQNIKRIEILKLFNLITWRISFFRQNLKCWLNLFDPVEGLKVPQQFEKDLDLPNKSYLTTSIGLAFRKLDVFEYKFVTAAKI